MRFAVLLTFALAGCASRWGDPHAPKTVVADEAGGAVTVNHGARLQIPLVNDPGAAGPGPAVLPNSPHQRFR